MWLNYTLRSWSWDSRDSRWQEGFHYLKQFYQKNGLCKISQKYQTGNGYNLDVWVSRQRNRKDKLSKEYKNLLESLDGWVWDLVISDDSTIAVSNMCDLCDSYMVILYVHDGHSMWHVGEKFFIHFILYIHNQP